MIRDIRLAWLTSVADEYATDLLCMVLKAGIRPVVVFCDSSESEYLDRLRRICGEANLSLVVREPPRMLHKESRGSWRERYDQMIVNELAAYQVDILFLVGYMRIVSSTITNRFSTMNLHPAQPLGPTGRWQDVIWGLIAVRARFAGATVQIVTDTLDRGPVVAYCEVSIYDSKIRPAWRNLSEKLRTKDLVAIRSEEGEQEPLFAAIRSRQFAREAPLIISTINKIKERSLNLTESGGRLIGSQYCGAPCLTAEVEEHLEEMERTGRHRAEAE